jgi:glycosyltransferase involved in cell wall biosynthesis
MRVLLISALPEIDPACGDVTYTQTLLAHPPDGVVYETYAEALNNGNLREHFTSSSFKEAWTAKRDWFPELAIGLFCKAINVLRGSGLFYTEQFRFFSVKPGVYDLIHLHVFHVRFLNLPCPLVVTAGCPLQYVYADGRHWSKLHMLIADTFENLIGRIFQVNLNSHKLTQATRYLTYTEDARNWFANHGVFAREKIDIVPIYKEPADRIKTDRKPKKILFVAREFYAKGGKTVLNAFEQVRKVHPDAELHIIGSQPIQEEAIASNSNITWTPYIPRERLLEMFADYDVFAYPTEFDCISYVLLEAMSHGLPIATSDYPSMPESVAFGEAGKISKVGDAEGLARNIVELLDPAINAEFSRRSLAHFQKTYSSETVPKKLLNSYNLSLPTTALKVPF